MENDPDRLRFMELWNLEVQVSTKAPIRCKWERPGEGTTVLNSNGTLQGINGGWGAALRDHEGKVMAAAKGRSKFNSIALIELEGVYKGLKLAMQNRCSKVEARTDSTNVILFINK
ncbi:hypothetical protein IFM89_008225 [Coptis chinensis]|uniref:RNase H type-1 domain-containing protein n=1 Tax=Coptis chinensis TaxID=261450 RepID=A0A835I8B5_9MAGN|nr:hypothetical protein IFM89_008225 [Coptis chinensis]